MNKHIWRRPIALVMIGLMLSMFCTAPARATAEYALQTGVSWYRIDNPFLYPNGSGSQSLYTAGSAWSEDLRGGLFLPMPTERSNLQLTGAVSQMHYGNTFNNYNDQLSTGGPYSLNKAIKQLEASYTWEFSDFLRGRLFHRIDDRLYSYYGGEIVPDPNTVPRNISGIEPEFPHTREDSAEIAYRINNHVDLPITWSQQTLSFLNAGRAEMYNMNSTALQSAIRYTSSAESTMSAGVKRTKVSFPDRIADDIAQYDSGYIDTEFFTDLAWHYSNQTTFLAHVGGLTRHFNTINDRDSRLLSAELGMNWHYSPKTTLSGRIWNHPLPNDQADSQLYVITHGIETKALWQATPKTQVSMLASVEIQKSQTFNDTLITSPLVSSNDKVVNLNLRVDHNITRNLSVRVDLTRQTAAARDDTNLFYRRSTVMISLNYTFDNFSGPYTDDNPQGFNRARQQIETLQ